MLHSCITRVTPSVTGNQPELGHTHKMLPSTGWTGKWNLLRRRKNSGAERQPPHLSEAVHEHRLGEVHLPSNLLQFKVGETLRVGEHGDRVAAERLHGEHVELDKSLSVRRSGIQAFQSGMNPVCPVYHVYLVFWDENRPDTIHMNKTRLAVGFIILLGV